MPIAVNSRELRGEICRALTAVWIDLRAVRLVVREMPHRAERSRRCRHEVVRASGTKGILLRFGRLLSPSSPAGAWGIALSAEKCRKHDHPAAY